MRTQRDLALRSLPVVALLMIALCVESAWGQFRFQSRFGGLQSDAGRGGVFRLASGGYIAVGESNSFGNDYDVYLIRADNSGALVWSRTYDLGGDDSAKSVIQSKRDGHFYITGITENKNGCTRDDIFLLKVDSADGDVHWAKTYGGNGYEIGYDLAEDRPDLYIVGSTQSFGGRDSTDRWTDDWDLDGIVMRLDSNGNVLWGRTYGGASNDQFFAAWGPVGFGDVYVTGSTYSYGLGEQIWLLRVSFRGNLMWAYAYGDTGREQARGIRLCDTTLMLCGLTTSPLWGVQGPHPDMLFLSTNRDGRMANTRTVGTDSLEYGTWVRYPFHFEDSVVIGSGVADENPNGFGQTDMLLVKTPIDLSKPPLFKMLYGGTGLDEGWSVEQSFNVLQKDEGFIATGWTTSFTAGDRDLYLVKVDKRGRSAALCNADTFRGRSVYTPLVGEYPINPRISRVYIQCARTVVAGSNMSWSRICDQDSIPKDTMPRDTTPRDTLPRDTLPRDTIIYHDTLRFGQNMQALPPTYKLGAVPAAPVRERRRRGEESAALPSKRVNDDGVVRGADRRGGAPGEPLRPATRRKSEAVRAERREGSGSR